MLYRRFLIGFLALSLVFTSCVSPHKTLEGDATAVLEEILMQFPMPEGMIYSDRAEAAYPLTDALLARMFPDTGDMADFAYVVSVAVCVSRRFSDGEITVLELCDLSHREELKRLLKKRADKKENAVVFTNGVYVFLIATDHNEAIMRDWG